MTKVFDNVLGFLALFVSAFMFIADLMLWLIKTFVVISIAAFLMYFTSQQLSK